MSTSIQEAHPGQVESENSEYEIDDQVRSKRSGQPYEENDKNDQVQNENDENDQRSTPVTYEQLRERIKKRYCGSNLV